VKCSCWLSDMKFKSNLGIARKLHKALKVQMLFHQSGVIKSRGHRYIAVDGKFSEKMNM